MPIEARQDLAQRVEQVIGALQRSEGARCAACSASLCGHQVLLSMVLGYQDQPHCLDCLATALGRDRQILRDEMEAYILGKECLSYGWRWTNLRETGKTQVKPACLWGSGIREEPPLDRGVSGPASVMKEVEGVSAEWDAGDLGCGELVLELRTRMVALGPGQILKLAARDPGAPEDLPAWCGMTGHALLQARHPDYWIRRRS